MAAGHQYELEIVKELEEVFKGLLKVSKKQFSHNKRFTGRSGATHQIDISLEYEIGGVKFLIAVECKALTRKVEKSHVATFSSVLKDIGGSKGLIVTINGFQKGAVEFAKHENIALATYCNFAYTPLIGDPEYYVMYEQNVIQYLSELHPQSQRAPILEYGNAYRAELILNANDSPNKVVCEQKGQRVEAGFVLNGETTQPLVCSEDLQQILLFYPGY